MRNMKTSFTSKQREILARKMGYDGPMQGFDDFLNSSPALMMKYNAVTDKYAQRMAKGGSVTSYAAGGVVSYEEWLKTAPTTKRALGGRQVPISEADLKKNYEAYRTAQQQTVDLYRDVLGRAPENQQVVDEFAKQIQSLGFDKAKQEFIKGAQPELERQNKMRQDAATARESSPISNLPQGSTGTISRGGTFQQTEPYGPPAQVQAPAPAVWKEMDTATPTRQQTQFFNSWTGKTEFVPFDVMDQGQEAVNKYIQDTKAAPAAPSPAPAAPSPAPAAPSPAPAPPAPAPAATAPAATAPAATAPSPAPAPAATAPSPSPAPAPAPGVTGGGDVTFSEEQGRTGVPSPGAAAVFTPATTPITAEQTIAGIGGAGAATTARTDQTATAAQAATPKTIKATTAEATQAAEGVKAALEGTKPLSFEEWSKDKAFPTYILPDGRAPAEAAYEEYVRTFKPEGGVQAAQGTVGEQAQVRPAEGVVSEGAIAKAPEAPGAAQVTAPTPLQMTEEQKAKAATIADVGGVTTAAPQVTTAEFKADAAQLSGTPQASAATNYSLPETKYAGMDAPTVLPPSKAAEIPSANTEQTTASSTAVAQQRAISQEEIIDVSKQALQIDQPVQAVAATMDKLNEEAKMQAQQGSFSQYLAEAQTGTVSAASTVAGQMEKLMQQFNDGTPAWAAGAIRRANAAMAARGLGGSSMAGAAIVQAAMEAAIPIAAADAQVFANMDMQNLSNKQQVALANAAAQQGLELQNLSNRQAAALQNSTNAFALQTQSLSNMQQVVLANANIKAAVAEKNLDVKTQTSLANAARYAEVNNINLSNSQQAVLARSAENLQVEFTNLSARQQTALSNLQVQAAIRGQELTNDQQMAVLQSTQNFEAAGIEASNKQQAFIADFQARAALEGQVLSNQQQTALFNVSSVLQERNLNLNNEQQTRLFNTTNAMNIDLANLSNKQQTALANAQIEAALKGQELTNKQQTNIVNAARVAEIANVNFSAEQQNALANAQFIQQINLADLSNQQATVLANAATFASMDMANLNNRQQAAVLNAQSFLQMDMSNLDRDQQATLFKGQQMVQTLLSDAAAENAMKQFNASSQTQVDQFMVTMASQVSQFNAAQKNALEQFNTDQANAVAKFNAEQTNARDNFNAQQRLVIDQSNAQWRREVSTADTAALNAALYLGAQNLQQMTLAEYNNETQLYRDQLEKAWSSFEKNEDRVRDIMVSQISAKASTDVAEANLLVDFGEAVADIFF